MSAKPNNSTIIMRVVVLNHDIIILIKYIEPILLLTATTGLCYS